MSSPTFEQTFEQQIASFLNIAIDRITIQDNKILIHCSCDREMIDIQNEWCRFTLNFSDRAKYLVLYKDYYQLPLPMSPGMWQAMSYSLAGTSPR